MDEFEEHRSHLHAVAYRMLGSVPEAEDAVQEAWLRMDRADVGDVRNMRGWLTTVVAHICLDMLRGRTARPEQSLDEDAAPHTATTEPVDPEQQALLADSVGAALLVILQRLSPAERLASAVRRDRADRGSLGELRRPARGPCPPPRARPDSRSRNGFGPPAPTGRRVPYRGPRR
jgi:RNA polymerase sigma factor (sigma-70 family)